MRSGLNSHYFHIIGDDKLINPIVGVYIPIVRIPYCAGGRFPIPNTTSLDPGSNGDDPNWDDPPTAVGIWTLAPGRRTST